MVYVGSRTGNDGINGAAMASAEFTSDSDMEALKSNIQKGDAFLEKLLMEACLEIVDADLLQGMQDMGAGGLLCSSVEVVLRGRNKTGEDLGCVMNVDKVPQKSGSSIDECDKLISESQERMLLVVKPENIETTSLGVAYLAGLNAGLIKNVNEISKFWKKNKIAKPNTSKKIIETEIKTWKKTVKNLISLNS